jgi:hypothetical protein
MSMPASPSGGQTKSKCTICLSLFDPDQIAFRCAQCTDGLICRKDTAGWFSAWRARAIIDCGVTADTGQRFCFLYFNRPLTCTVCRSSVDPGAADTSLRWYSTIAAVPTAQGQYLMIQNASQATAAFDQFVNGYQERIGFADYSAFLGQQQAIPGECPFCTYRNGSYVKIKAAYAQTLGKQPWGNGPPTCLVCPSGPPIGRNDDLLFCQTCKGSVLHAAHHTAHGWDMIAPTFYTETFKPTTQ